jgi:hypothetical protein
MKFIEYLKTVYSRMKSGPIKQVVGMVMGVILLIKTIFFSRFTILLFGMAAGFFFGARLSEIGALEGLFGKDLKGATVYLSGPCKVNGVPRVPALAEDEVKITGEVDGMLTGVIRKTREVVLCDTKITAVDKAPTQIPELEAMKIDAKDPEWKKLVQKTLIMSGSCFSTTGKELPAFTDEKVDVTDIKPDKEDSNNFIISGIKKADKIAVNCRNISVKYSIYEEKAEQPVVTPETPKVHSYLGEKILVTGKCFPDPRTPKYAGQSRVAYYPLVNALVQVNEEVLDSSGNLKKFVGAVLSKVDENKRAIFAVCDMAKIPFTFKPYDGDSMKLAPITDAAEDGEVSSKVVPATAPNPDQAPVDAAAPAKGTN